MYLFAGVTGDLNPVHVDAEFAKTTPFGARVAHGPLTFSLCAGLLGTELPGVGTIAVTNQVAYRSARSTSATRSRSRSRSASSTSSATGPRWPSPGTTRTATRSPRAQMVVAPPKEPVSL